MWSSKSIAALLGAVALAFAAAACGSSESSSPGGSTSANSGLESGGYMSPVTESLTGKKGGKLVVLQETEFEHLDPGLSHYNLDYPVVFATQRPLYSYKPNQENEIHPRRRIGSA